MKKILWPIACAAMLSACAAGHPSNKQPGPQSVTTTTISGQSAKDIADQLAVRPQTDMPTDANVQMYKTSGPFANPLTHQRPHSILDNTTSGGYTVFDESVTVYPLPGEAAPGFMPAYAVPPFKDLGEEPELRKDGTVGKPLGLASAGNLPPVKNVEVASADPFASPPVAGASRRTTMSLTSPEPLTMQPPAAASPGPRSPFAKASAPMLTGADDMAVGASAPATGRRATSLTGY